MIQKYYQDSTIQITCGEYREHTNLKSSILGNKLQTLKYKNLIPELFMTEKFQWLPLKKKSYCWLSKCLEGFC